MSPSPEQAKAAAETHLQRTLTSVLNGLPADAALAAVFHQEQGPLTAQVHRGFTPRDVQAIVRTLSSQKVLTAVPADAEASRTVRLRLVTPGAKSLLGMPLRHRQRTYGFLVIGRKDNATFAKKDKAMLEQAGDDITKALERDSLFDLNMLLSRPLVSKEPLPSPATVEAFTAPTSHATPELQEKVVALLNELGQTLPFDRAWIGAYDPLAGNVEVLGIAGEHKTDPKDQKKDLKAGQRLALDASAAGWAVRHRKPRVDHDLASTQGRFLDHKYLYKDRFQSSLVLPFFLRGQVGGIITLASKEADRFTVSDTRLLEPINLKLLDLLQAAPPAPSTAVKAEGAPEAEAGAVPQAPAEPVIRKQERQAAIGEFSAFLATEIREPLASIRAQLEEVTAEGILDFDPQTRVENAMRDLIRIEAILNEILDFAKPLDLNRRLCRVPEMVENALTVVATELEATRIQVIKDYASVLAPVRADEAKMQQVFLSIFKNAIEAMTPGGILTISISNQRAGRHLEVQTLIKNNGTPIPPEHVDKVFEPFFTTKRSGTGLGLATVKKIVEEHQGTIAIAGIPGEGTTVTMRMPGVSRGPAHRYRGRGRRPPRRPTA
ncbi:MAG: Adaptive-response sensory-kinase SasA [Nitrospirae bacterium]|nr:MAG: putative sensor histidine kinase [Nitrospira sp. OLB3]MBV6468920.1 Adaptive-response sensory-kinase SasA [Nitrospirota bacterium]MCE7966134.1 GAF domain-containing protein [Nitrospira sp. NTP2]MCK6492914.1 ATP-binding protein [Nitrospira sp.]MEB2339165.1 ATP-binding protein [Nitrospirales bacterium]